jgi:sigma-B regulation protein RsbU (phosphoserine phosphatase)
LSDDSGTPGSGFRSLTTRLIFWILLASGPALLLTTVLSNSRSRITAIRAAEREAEAMAEATISHIREILRSVEEDARLLSGVLQTLEPSRPEMEALLREVPAGNPSLHGAGAFFDPRPGSEPLGLHAYREPERPGTGIVVHVAAEGDRFWESDWYISAKAPLWSEPYADEEGDGRLLVRYAVPFFSAESTFRGVVTADLDLEFLNREVQASSPGTESASSADSEDRGFAVILSRSGRVLAARDVTRIRSRESLLDQLDAESRAKTAPVVERMLAGGSGFESLEVADRTYRVRYAPVMATGWSVAVLYPEEELFRHVRQLRWLQASLGLAGLFVLALAVVLLSRRFTRPLQQLAGSAGRLATGELDCDLPAVKSRDEVGTLTAAFHHMQSSLKEYVRDLEETTRAKERLESELRVARRIQMAMLPESSAGGPTEAYQLEARLVPARAVGGDLFDHFQRDGKVFFLVADVSGKGVPAALFMARTKALFENVAARETDPGAILRQVNGGLCAENEEGMFVTGACGYLETRTGELWFASAGHDPPAHVRVPGAPELLKASGGPVMGLIAEAEFPVNRSRLAPNESVVLYTDGVTEAQNLSEDYFTSERLLAILGESNGLDAPGLADRVLGAVREFASEAPQSDDITVLVLQRSLARPR